VVVEDMLTLVFFGISIAIYYDQDLLLFPVSAVGIFLLIFWLFCVKSKND